MNPWVTFSIGVAVAAAISAKPLTRLRKPEKNDKLKLCLSVAILLAAAVIGWSRPRKAATGGSAVKYLRPLPVYRGGAQCTVKSVPQAGAGYQPYVVPDDLTFGGSGSGVAKAVAIVPETKPVFTYPTVPPAEPAVSYARPEPAATDVVVGGTLRLVGDF